MQFLVRKRRSAPTVIIISLIDVLIVVLIFLMLTTIPKKQQPAAELVLPESKQSKHGASENSFVVTIPKQGPLILKNEPMTLDKLQAKLTEAVRQNPETTLSIRADTDAPFGQIIKVMDAAKAANIKTVSAFTKAQP